METGSESVRFGAYLSKVDSNELFWTGWYDSIYDEELGNQPCIFTSVTPVSRPVVDFSAPRAYREKAWNNVNLTRLAEKIKSPLVLSVSPS